MEPRIVYLEPKTLVGVRKKMSIAENTTPELWRSFMPRRKLVENRSSGSYFSMQVYSRDEKDFFAPFTIFEKWAAVEVSMITHVPDGMEIYNLQGGKYAVFIHEGPAITFPSTMRYILNKWIPESIYEIDNREFFEVLPEGYNPQDQNAREEVWIPVK